MKLEEIKTRSTGLSLPVVGGVQWNPPESQRAIARRVIRFLEDRRVLYVPHDVEIAEYCAQSVLEIRQMLTTELGNLDESCGQLYYSLQAMRLACRRFLDRTQGPEGGSRRFRRPYSHYDIENQTFFTALGELRAAIGVHVAIIAAQHSLDIEGDLATILPAAEEDKIYPYI